MAESVSATKKQAAQDIQRFHDVMSLENAKFLPEFAFDATKKSFLSSIKEAYKECVEPKNEKIREQANTIKKKNAEIKKLKAVIIDKELEDVSSAKRQKTKK